MRRRVIATVVLMALGTLSALAAIGPRARDARAQVAAVRAPEADSSVGALERATRAAPDDAELHFRLALAYGREAVEAGFFRPPVLARRMVSELRRTVTIAPGHVRAHEELARFHLNAPRILGGGLNRARAEMVLLRTSAPERALVIGGWIAHHEGRARAAEQAFRDVVAQYPDSSAAFLGLGHVLRDGERNDEAFAAFARAAALKPDNLQALNQMGFIGATTGTHLEAAETAMRRYIALGGGESSRAAAHRRMGMIYEKLGKVAQARAEYSRALELRSSDSDAREGLRRLR